MKGVIKKLLSMPRSRIVIGVMCVFFIVGFAVNSCSNTTDTDHGQTMNSSIEDTALNLQHNSAISANDYQQKLDHYNSDQYHQAEITGKSYFQQPNGRINDVSGDRSNPLTDQQNGQQKEKKKEKQEKQKGQYSQGTDTSTVSSNSLASVQSVHARHMKLAHSLSEDESSTLAQRAQKDLDDVYGQPIDNQQAQQLYQKDVQGVVAKWSNQSNMETKDAPKDNANMTNNGEISSQNKAVLVKAGYIGFAVIDTSVNSDQIGTPVLAHIVEGPLKGSKLLGSFTREGDYIVVKFNLMSMPSRSNSISINAYAVDGSTAQIALASDVNHHYIERYGSLFAAAFLQGFGTYFSNQNQNQQICLSGQSGGLLPCFNVNSNNQPSVKSAAFSGLGQVGTALSSNMASVFNRPPTVKLYQGTGVGILFTNDVNA
ncbi:DotG/IcmE/VirB10 family protein [Cysteiniphilum sp. 6C5]|uniref:DotG/IcmE/VirB10 family protein n=1 Tax=unclassified Cysteiniphilum TaxID=2610889 RepID=UPI003F83A7FE